MERFLSAPRGQDGPELQVVRMGQSSGSASQETSVKKVWSPQPFSLHGPSCTQDLTETAS